MNLKDKILSTHKIRGAMIFEFFSPGIPNILKNLRVLVKQNIILLKNHFMKYIKKNYV